MNDLRAFVLTILICRLLDSRFKGCESDLMDLVRALVGVFGILMNFMIWWC